MTSIEGFAVAGQSVEQPCRGRGPLKRYLAGNLLPMTKSTVNFEMRKGLVTLSLVKPQQNAGAILETYELLVCVDIHQFIS